MHRIIFLLFLILFFFCKFTLIFSHKAKNSNSIALKNFSGKLNKKGSTKISYSTDTKSSIFIQGFLFYLENWRPVNIFFNSSHLWFDLGPNYKELPYRIHILESHAKIINIQDTSISNSSTINNSSTKTNTLPKSTSKK